MAPVEPAKPATEGNGFRDAPSDATAIAAPQLAASSDGVMTSARAGRRWQTFVAMAPAIGMSLLPKVACPACWPAYAGVLGALGFGFLLDAAYLLPLTSVFLTIALGALAFRAKRRRGYGPFLIGVTAATVVLIGKFAFDSDAAMYVGVAALVCASTWNSWPRRSQETCPACASPHEQPSPT